VSNEQQHKDKLDQQVLQIYIKRYEQAVQKLAKEHASGAEAAFNALAETIKKRLIEEFAKKTEFKYEDGYAVYRIKLSEPKRRGRPKKEEGDNGEA